MNKQPITVKLTFILILINAVFWFGYGVLMGLGGIAPMSANLSARWVMGGLALVSAAALAGVAYLLSKRIKLVYFGSVVLLALIAVLSITDQVGWLDLFSLLASLVPLVLLIKDGRWYLRKGDA